jgi:hypothetical protein
VKGFIVWLIPLDPSGIERNKVFAEKNHGKLMFGGTAEMQSDGRLKCEWMFGEKLPMPDAGKKLMLKQFTDGLDKAIADKTNVRYEVEFIN